MHDQVRKFSKKKTFIKKESLTNMLDFFKVCSVKDE